jgi:GT2 family glycosyltransferase
MGLFRMKVAILVPTLNAGSEWKSWIQAVLATGVAPADVYIVDSGSSDGTVEQARDAGFDVQLIDRAEFDHGATRQRLVDMLDDYEYAVFLTQDAVLSASDSIKNILSPFASDRVAAVCGRQLPRKEAGSIERHARLFNYPRASSVNSINDAGVKGLKAAFLSNSFAAYRISALLGIGGFPVNVIFGEDMYVATKLLKAGYQVAYAAEASVYHSHDYSLWQEMKRYFDMGVFHAREPWIRHELGGAEGEGVKFVVSELGYVSKHAFWRMPEVLMRTLLRYSGFRLGLLEGKLPLWLKRKLAMNKRYFKRKY